MNARRFSLCMALVSTALALGIGAPASAAGDRPVLSVTATEAAYATGTPAELRFTVTNGTPAACRLSRSSYGTYAVQAMTRDGLPVPPVLGSATFYQGIETEIRANMTTVQPGASIEIRPVIVDDSIMSATPVGSGVALTSLWPISTPGRYTVTVRYAPPQLESLSTQCVGESATATVSFRISAKAASTSHTLRIAEIVAGGVLLLILLIALWWWLRRRGGRASAAAAAILVIACVVMGGANIGARPAAARWITAGGGQPFLDDVKKCFAKFEHTKGGDPSHVMATIERANGPILTISPPVDYAQGSVTLKSHAGPGGASTATTIWNNTDIAHSDGGKADRCADLYHEMVHAYQDLTDLDSLDYCDESHIFYDEVEAALEENQYRAAHKDGIRETYNGRPLPGSMERCDRKPVEEEVGRCFEHPGNQIDVGVYADERALARADGAASPCAMNNGDPHLTTFDGRHYDFQGVGEFVDTRSTSGDLEIQTRQSPLPGSRYAAIDVAVAMRIGADGASGHSPSDTVGFYYDQGAITVHVNGSPIATIGDATTDTGTLTLPGGGTIERRPSTVANGGDAFTVTWPDGSAAWIDPVRPWGLRLEVQVAGARAQQVSGLLGNFDGKDTNDLVTSADTVLPAVPTYTQLYHDFADSWRVTQASSLFDYGTGETTDTFTDRTFPDIRKNYTGPSAAAKAECAYAGVTDPALVADCAFDVDETGSLSFAADDVDIQQAINQATTTTTPAPLPGQSGTVTITGADASGTFPFTGSSGQHIYISIVTTGLPEGCYVTVTDPDGRPFTSGCVVADLGTVDTTVLPAAGTYHVVLKPPAGSSGTAQVQVYTDVDETVPITIGGNASVAVSQPGAVATATFNATAGQKVYTDVTTDFDGTCGELQLYGPGDSLLETGCVLGRDGTLDGITLPVSGAYRIVLDPAGGTTGSATIHLASATDQTQATTIGASAVTMTVSQAGAISTVTFPATAGERFAAVLASKDFNACGIVALYGPDGSELTSACLIDGVGSFDTMTLATTGTYRLVLDPSSTATGTVTVVLAHN